MRRSLFDAIFRARASGTNITRTQITMRERASLILPKKKRKIFIAAACHDVGQSRNASIFWAALLRGFFLSYFLSFAAIFKSHKMLPLHGALNPLIRCYVISPPSPCCFPALLFLSSFSFLTRFMFLFSFFFFSGSRRARRGLALPASRNISELSPSGVRVIFRRLLDSSYPLVFVMTGFS